MPVTLGGNMRARATARCGKAVCGESRLGGVAIDVDTASQSNHYKWTMTRGVKRLDTGLTEDGWTSSRR
jgi:hypothetical protein